MKKKKKMSRGSSRTNVQVREKIGSMNHFKYDSAPSNIMNENPSDGQSIADRELKRMVKADVFRSNSKTVKQTNSNTRRYK